MMPRTNGKAEFKRAFASAAFKATALCLSCAISSHLDNLKAEKPAFLYNLDVLEKVICVNRGKVADAKESFPQEKRLRIGERDAVTLQKALRVARWQQRWIGNLNRSATVYTNIHEDVHVPG